MWCSMSAFAAYKRDCCLSWHCTTLQEVLIRICTFVLSLWIPSRFANGEAVAFSQPFSSRSWLPMCVSYVVTASSILVYILPAFSSLRVCFSVCKVNLIVYLLFHNFFLWWRVINFLKKYFQSYKIIYHLAIT